MEKSLLGVRVIFKAMDYNENK